MGLCVFSLPISLVMIERIYIYIYTLSYYHHQIGGMYNYPLFRVRPWNNGVRCMSFYILKKMRHEKTPHMGSSSGAMIHPQPTPFSGRNCDRYHWKHVIFLCMVVKCRKGWTKRAYIHTIKDDWSFPEGQRSSNLKCKHHLKKDVFSH